MAVPDGGPANMLGSADNNVAFEGQHAFVTLVHAPIDVSDAYLTFPAELDPRDVRCAGSVCAIVAEVLDTTPSTGTPIPAPIDAMVRQILLDTDAGRVSATINVMPLDRIESAGGESTVRGTYFASAIDVGGGAIFRGAPGAEPIRWVVFGDVDLTGSIDVSAVDAMAGPGGLDGGEVGAAAMGEGAGMPGEGGGSAEEGLGIGGAPGGPAWASGCAGDFFAGECGGGGGGGDATSEGGGGAGTFALVSLGRVTFVGEVLARGGDGGGGGGGGRVLVSGVSLGAEPTVDTFGGAGASGADGGAGERTGSGLMTSSVGAALDLPGYILDTPTFVIDATASEGAVLRAETIDGAPLGTSAMAGADGALRLEITLPEGFSRVRLFLTEVGGVERRLFVGNHFELERRSSRMQPQPVGGLVDVVYLPGT